MLIACSVTTEQITDALFAARLCELSPFRFDKAERAVSGEARAQSLAASFALSEALHRIGKREKEMEYGIGENGKPFFKNAPSLHFSLSHTQGRALAVLADAPVGCDIEKLRPVKPGIARRFFTAAEADMLEALPPAQSPAAFFKIWTAKESYQKLTGCGLSLPMSAFSISLSPGPELIPPAGGENALLALYDGFPEYICALCAVNPDRPFFPIDINLLSD